MKIKSLVFVCSLALMGSLFAANRHVHKEEVNGPEQKSMMPGYCEIEIKNLSSSSVVVNGDFDDGYVLETFNIYRYGYDTPHYISLFYNGYCHRYMYLDIDTFSGFPVYMHKLVYTGTQVLIYDSAFDKQQLKVENLQK